MKRIVLSMHHPSMVHSWKLTHSGQPAGIVFGSCTLGVLVRVLGLLAMTIVWVLGLLALGHELLVLDIW